MYFWGWVAGTLDWLLGHVLQEGGWDVGLAPSSQNSRILIEAHPPTQMCQKVIHKFTSMKNYLITFDKTNLEFSQSYSNNGIKCFGFRHFDSAPKIRYLNNTKGQFYNYFARVI
jgi:hypothetical protein